MAQNRCRHLRTNPERNRPPVEERVRDVPLLHDGVLSVLFVQAGPVEQFSVGKKVPR